jgi:cyclase
MHAHSRRGFLRQTLGAVWTSAAILDQAVFRAAHATAQSAASSATLFDIEKVADGVYAALARPQALINCNAAIFENANDVLIVDTHSKPSAAAALVAQIRKTITTKPIRYIINTHFHLDHTQGAPAYSKLAPHADVIACAATRNLLAEVGASRAKESVEAARKSLDDYRQKLAAAKSADVKAYYQAMARETTGYIKQMQGYEPVLPNITFDQGLVIHDRAHELRLSFSGRGHTAGDIVLCSPEKRVIATGDLLHGFLPTLLDGYPKEWPGTLRAVGKMEFDHVLPGHGAVQHSRQPLGHMVAYLEEITEKVERGKQSGRTSLELQKEITPQSLATLQSENYGVFVGETLLKYMANPPGTTLAEVVADGVRGNVDHIYQRLGVR